MRIAQVVVEHSLITWPGDLDLALDAMYGPIQKNGQWAPSEIPRT